MAADPTLTKKMGINAFDLYANWCFLMQFESPLNLENHNDLKNYHITDTYIKAPMAIYSYRPSQSMTDPADERATLVSEERTKLKSYMTIAEAELLTAPTEEAFEAKYAEIAATRPSIYDQDLVIAYSDDNLQRAKAQLGVKFFFPPYIAAEGK